MSFWLVHLHVRGFSLRLPHPLWVQPEPLAQSSHAHQLLPGTHTIRHASDWPGGHAGGLLQSSCTWQFVQLLPTVGEARKNACTGPVFNHLRLEMVLF